ncbi:hypothetical protein YPPY07_3607, partial [Yersinia pestis PY-07]
MVFPANKFKFIS